MHINSKSEALRAMRALRQQKRDALAAYPGGDVRTGFVISYYACYKALILHRPRRHMPELALRRYMRFCRIAVAENTALKRHDIPPERLTRIKQLRDRAWLAYQGCDRNGPVAA